MTKSILFFAFCAILVGCAKNPTAVQLNHPPSFVSATVKPDTIDYTDSSFVDDARYFTASVVLHDEDGIYDIKRVWADWHFPNGFAFTLELQKKSGTTTWETFNSSVYSSAPFSKGTYWLIYHAKDSAGNENSNYLASLFYVKIGR